MRDKGATRSYYIDQLGFKQLGSADYDEYLMLGKEGVEIHFFLFRDLNPLENYGQVYIRTDNIEGLYKSLMDNKVKIHPNAPLQIKPWGQKEFALIDPDGNLLTFGQGMG